MKTLLFLLVVFLAALLGHSEARTRNRIKHQRTLDVIDPCHLHDCPKGRKCYINVTSGNAECMCRPKCKNHVRPVCGSDGMMYDNHCELHRAACLTGRHISVMHNVGCTHATAAAPTVPPTVPPTVLPITPVLSTTTMYRAENSEWEEDTIDEVVTETLNDDVPATERIPLEDDDDIPDDEFENSTEEVAETEVVQAPVDVIKISRNCSRADFREYKIQVLNHYRKQFGNPGGNNNPSSPPMTIKFLISYLFNHLDTDKNDKLTVDELNDALTRDNIGNISHTCTLEDFLRADKNRDGRLVAPELYDVFGIDPISIADHNKVRSTVATAGQNIVLGCDVETDYNLGIAWERNGVSITEDSHFQGINVYQGDRSLYIVNTNVLHIGKYTCYAVAYPSVKQVHMLTVQVAPSVTMCPPNQLVQKGSTTKIQCYAQGIPKPRKSWFRNQNTLQSRDKFQLDDSNSSLMVRHIDYADTGIFDCVAINDVDSVSTSASIFIQDTSSTDSLKERNVYFFFHQYGIQVLEPDTCTFQLTLRADKRLPEDKGSLCSMNHTSGRRECTWGAAVNVRNRYIYASQPTLKRVIVIDLRLDQIVEVITMDKMPVSLTHIPHTDAIWIEEWQQDTDLQRGALHSIKVLRGVSQPPPHRPVHLEPAGGRFDSIESLHIPTEQQTIAGPGGDGGSYGYIVHRGQTGLSRIDLAALTHAGRIDLGPEDCHPVSVAFVAVGGHLVVNCEGTSARPERQLLVDRVTGEFERFNDGVQGQVYTTPDGRHVISVDRREQHIQVQRVTDDGRVKTDFQVSTNLHISDLGFYPTMTAHGYDLFATSRDRDEVVFIDLASGKVEMISGVRRPIDAAAWRWDGHNRKIAASGPFGPYMVTPSEDHVIILNGQYRRLHCDVDHLVHANVFAWVGAC